MARQGHAPISWSDKDDLPIVRDGDTLARQERYSSTNDASLLTSCIRPALAGQSPHDNHTAHRLLACLPKCTICMYGWDLSQRGGYLGDIINAQSDIVPCFLQPRTGRCKIRLVGRGSLFGQEAIGRNAFVRPGHTRA